MGFNSELSTMILETRLKDMRDLDKTYPKKNSNPYGIGLRNVFKWERIQTVSTINCLNYQCWSLEIVCETS